MSAPGGIPETWVIVLNSGMTPGGTPELGSERPAVVADAHDHYVVRLALGARQSSRMVRSTGIRESRSSSRLICARRPVRAM